MPTYTIVLPEDFELRALYQFTGEFAIDYCWAINLSSPGGTYHGRGWTIDEAVARATAGPGSKELVRTARALREKPAPSVRPDLRKLDLGDLS